MTKIPLPLRKQIDEDKFYKSCALYGQHGHICDGRITMDHTVIFAGKQVQELWAIVPVCAHGHGVDNFQDDANTSKEIRLWVALNRATDPELRAVSKVSPGYIHERKRLNTKFGTYEQKMPSPSELINSKPPATATGDGKWYFITHKDEAKIERIREFEKTLGMKLTLHQTIEMAIDDLYLSIHNHLDGHDKELFTKLGFAKKI